MTFSVWVSNRGSFHNYVEPRADWYLVAITGLRGCFLGSLAPRGVGAASLCKRWLVPPGRSFAQGLTVLRSSPLDLR